VFQLIDVAGKCEQRGQNRGRRMASECVVAIVEIEGVRRRAVDERCAISGEFTEAETSAESLFTIARM
jgi:hypothetical protein